MTIARLNALDPQARAIAVGAFGREPTDTEPEHEAARLTAILDSLDAGAGDVAAIEALAKAEPYGSDFTDHADIPLTSRLLRERIKAMADDDRALFVEAWKASGAPMTLAKDGEDVVLTVADYAKVEQVIAEHEPRPTDTTMSEANGALITALSDAERHVLEERLRAVNIDPSRTGYFSTVGRQWAVNVMATEWTEELAAGRADAEERKADLPSGEPTVIATTPVTDEKDLANTPPEGVTMADLLVWVGEDKARAAKVLAIEEAKAKPRKGVVAKCNVILATSTGEAATETTPPSPPSAPEEPSNVVDITTGEPVADEGGPTNLVLESAAFRSVPMDEWGPLTYAAYFSRLSEEMERGAGILARAAKALNEQASKDLNA